MELRRNFTKNLGTHYGLYAGSELIHVEYSRSAAEDILERIQAGEMLAEILNERFEKLHDSKIAEIEKKFEKNRTELVRLNFGIANRKEITRRLENLNTRLSIKYLSSEYDLEGM
ncbi:hypothetical protein [Endozoicomonas atrinae]|uniref:hypothetical protein n=1 Tax=Endozoicomonas atrinae TaxID=1333660 RepID=UPI0008250CF6|nr:hypothetical protein [Endozoicomonas atrinae]